MLQKIINFVKFHNAVSIGISLILVLSFSAIASEDVRDAVLGGKIVTEQGIDNSALLAADLANFDLAMKIINVTEDSEPANNSENNKIGNYYIDYEYKTMGIQDDIWKPILRRKQMTISKAALQGRDLGLYVAEELGEIADNEIAYLKEVQKNEQEKGQTFIQETTKYTGLIGLVLDNKTKELPGYEPVIKPPEPAASTPAETESPTISPTPISTPQEIGFPAPTPTPASTPTPTPIATFEPSPTPQPEAGPPGAETPIPTESGSPVPTP